MPPLLTDALPPPRSLRGWRRRVADLALSVTLVATLAVAGAALAERYDAGPAAAAPAGAVRTG